VNTAYLIFNSIWSIGIACTFIGVGLYMLIGPLRTKKDTKRFDFFMNMTIVVVVTFGFMFIVRSAIVLYSTISGVPSPLIVFALLELVPTFGTLYLSSL